MIKDQADPKMIPMGRQVGMTWEAALTAFDTAVNIAKATLYEPARGLFCSNYASALGIIYQGPQPQWEHCSPELLKSGVDCATTPRRPCECEVKGSHDHLVGMESPEGICARRIEAEAAYEAEHRTSETFIAGMRYAAQELRRPSRLDSLPNERQPLGCTCRGDLRGWNHLPTCPKYRGDVDDAKAEALEIGDCGFTERESAIKTLRQICELVEHDSPIYCLASEELSSLAHAQQIATEPSPSTDPCGACGETVAPRAYFYGSPRSACTDGTTCLARQKAGYGFDRIPRVPGPKEAPPLYGPDTAEPCTFARGDSVLLPPHAGTPKGIVNSVSVRVHVQFPNGSIGHFAPGELRSETAPKEDEQNKSELTRERDRSRSYADRLQMLDTRIAVLCAELGAPHMSHHDIGTLEARVKVVKPYWMQHITNPQPQEALAWAPLPLVDATLSLPFVASTDRMITCIVCGGGWSETGKPGVDYELLVGTTSGSAAVGLHERCRGRAEVFTRQVLGPSENQDDEFLDIVFDGPPSHESGRFVECEINGYSVRVGDWKEREDGLWSLRLPITPRKKTDP